jgi:dTDP-4-amino-4,6-dideoxygalactose transaminase
LLNVNPVSELTQVFVDYIPFLNFSFQHDQIRDAVKTAFLRVYDRSQFTLGKEVSEFEAEFGHFTEVPFCIGVGSGLDALTLSLLSCGITTADEVIVPAHTHFTTWLAICRAGGVPVPVDADAATYNIDVTKIESKISGKTKAILPVHLYGQPCDMTRIDELARQFDLAVVEDNAQSHGAMWREKRTGSFGTANATSFYPTTNLGALGDGGAVTVHDGAKAEFVRNNRNDGIRSRLDEIQASILRVKLLYLEQWNAERRRLAGLYLERLKDVPGLALPLAHKESVHVYHLFVILCDLREQLRDHLAKNKIETSLHYPTPPHLQEAFSGFGYKKGDFPVAEDIAESCLSLPIWPGMKDEQIEYVCDTIKNFF